MGILNWATVDKFETGLVKNKKTIQGIPVREEIRFHTTVPNLWTDTSKFSNNSPSYLILEFLANTLLYVSTRRSTKILTKT